MHLKYITSHFPGFILTLASPGARTLYESKAFAIHAEVEFVRIWGGNLNLWTFHLEWTIRIVLQHS